MSMSMEYIGAKRRECRYETEGKEMYIFVFGTDNESLRGYIKKRRENYYCI